MSKSFRGHFSFLAAFVAMAFVFAAGCSAEQGPDQSAQAAMQDAAAEAAETAEAAADEAEQLAAAAQESVSLEVAATDEAPPPEDIVVAQAEEAPMQDEPVAETAAVTPPAKPSGPAPYRVGDHYSLLSPAQPTSAAPGKIEITEFFMYSCPHCYNFEAFLEKWDAQKATYVQFVRYPALFNSPARTHARAFYTAETLGILDQTHMPFFRELHVNRRPMTSENELAGFFANYGVDESAFKQAFNSFAVDTQMRKAESLGRRYRITSTPTVVVNGKYVVDGDKITSYEEILKIADYLAQKEASGG